VDVLSLIGIALGFMAIVGGNFLEGGEFASLINIPAAVLVIGGTIGAGLLQMPMVGLRRAWEMLAWVFMPPSQQFSNGVDRVVRWATTARREGLLGLEAIAEIEQDPFSRKGLQLLVDGNEPESIRNVMEAESGLREQRDVDAAKFYEAMGGYAPTIGIIGAVVGLIHVMGNLEDPSRVGPGIAVAFVATIYGVGLANLLFLPVASKLRSCVREAAQYREMLIEGIIAIADGENPRAIELRLNGYLRS
jgi:chemotaxis protein MotA